MTHVVRWRSRLLAGATLSALGLASCEPLPPPVTPSAEQVAEASDLKARARALSAELQRMEGTLPEVRATLGGLRSQVGAASGDLDGNPNASNIESAKKTLEAAEAALALMVPNGHVTAETCAADADFALAYEATCKRLEDQARRPPPQPAEPKSAAESCPSCGQSLTGAVAAPREPTPEQESRREKQRQVRQAMAAYDAAQQRCEVDAAGPLPRACTDACSNDHAAYECVVMAALYFDGQKVAQNKARGLKLAREGCEAGNSLSCNAVKILQDKEQAERDLPTLFAQCEQNKAAVQRWRVAGISAARSGNGAAAQEAHDKLVELEPHWSDTLDKLQKAIETVTGGEGDRYERLVRDVQRRCDCQATPSGYCRR